MAGFETIGVCGAGVMGSQLAAFFASAGLEVHLFDVSQELSDNGLAGALGMKPPALYHRRFAERITALNYDDHLGRLRECDWVIEAIAERLDWKWDLYRRIEPSLRRDVVLSSNTSGLSIEKLAENLSEDVRSRFLITHFFNPPRFMRLVELVRGKDTREDVFERMASLVGKTLGKGVVHAKDTPNFVANRIGIYGMLLALELSHRMRLTVEQVDSLTGPVIGRPKSATFRTADVVGLDTLVFAAQTSYEKCPDDEARDLFATPPILAELVKRGWLGQKSKRGFYKKEGNEIQALDLETLEYRPSRKTRMEGIGVARRHTSLRRRIHALVYNPDIAGEFTWELTIGTLGYAARRVGEIADDVVNVDRALKWGYGWRLGPFEIWDAIGVEKSIRRMEREGKPVPELVRRLVESGHEAFYGRDDRGRRCYFDVGRGAMEPLAVEAGLVALCDEKARGGEILRNWSASLVDIGDGVGCVEFHSALQPEFNPIDGAILDILRRSLTLARERGMKGLVVSHERTHFCAGANLALILEQAKSGQFRMVEQASKTFQDITQAIRYAPFPVVAAPFSVCLGGGFEVIAPCHKIVALAELYCGAVEVGVGLIPGAGGNLRLLTHMSLRFPPRRFGPMVPVQKAFETIAFGKVSGSAHEAVELGYLREDDSIVLSRDHLITRAKDEVLRLSDGYAPPEPPELIPPGDGGRLAILAAVENLRRAGTISTHDALIAGKLAYVLTGGERANGIEPIEEQYLLDIEREAFVSLAGEPKSQERMVHMLKTGRPLRN